MSALPLLVAALLSTGHVALGFYDPNLGRWINRDPCQEREGMNLYGFVANSPLNWIDPFGWAIYPAGFIGPLQPGDTTSPLLPSGRVPHGYNPSWPTGTSRRGPYVQDPNTGRKYWPDVKRPDRHWEHYDWEDPDGKQGRYPEKCEKTRPAQKRPPYGDQSATDPWPSPPSGPPSTLPSTTPIIATPGVFGLPTYPTVTDPVMADPLWLDPMLVFP
jgi:hypothetical protein